MKATKLLAQTCYGLFALIFLAAGASVLVLPEPMKQAILEESHGDLNVLHILQELGSTLVFMGLTSFWFIRHYEVSQVFHWSMTAFWALIALVHWFDVRGGSASTGESLVIAIPLVLFLAIGVLRIASQCCPSPATGKQACCA
jgi:hypothetical protein